jgi:hypothetical protein
MVYGYGRGFGAGFGRGFGFGGASPPWPYVGRGRGGLPRCWAYGPYATTPYEGPGHWAPPAPEAELDYLKGESEMVKQHLDLVEKRISELEPAKAKGDKGQ